MAQSKQSANKEARSTTPPEVKSIGVREFLRGGIYNLDEPTVVMSHSDVIGTWVPRGQGLTATYYASSSTTPTMDSTFASTADAVAAGVSKAMEPVVELMLANIPKVDVTPALPKPARSRKKEY